MIAKYSMKIFSLLLLLNFSFLSAQWKTAASNKIVNDVIITYSVIYENDLSERQKKSSSYISEIVVAFNKNKLKEMRFGTTSGQQKFYFLDYKEEIFYNCMETSSSKAAIYDAFKNPYKEATLQKGKTKKIIGLPCEEYITIVKGVPTKIYSTQKFGLKFVKQFDIPGFLLDYTSYDKYLGRYRVVAQKINYAKLPESYYSLDKFTKITKEQYAEIRKKPSEKYKDLYDKMIGSKTPKYRFRTTEGEKISAKSNENKIVVLNFWFTTCPPCKSEIPHLNDLKEEFADNPDVVFLGIALDDKTKLENFINDHPFAYSLVSDGRYEAGMFNVPACPTNIVIDKKGIIKYYKVGGLSKTATRALSYKIDDLLEEE